MIDSDTVLFAKDVITTVSDDLIVRLKAMAMRAPLKRARFCLHHSPDDQVQEMVIVLHRDSHIRPHRHADKTESFHMIEGTVAIGFFDVEGTMMREVCLKAPPQGPFLYRLETSLWHSVAALGEFAVFHEVTTGPFIPAEFPPWEHSFSWCPR